MLGSLSVAISTRHREARKRRGDPPSLSQGEKRRCDPLDCFPPGLYLDFDPGSQ